MCKMGTSLWSGKYSVPPTELEKKLEGEEFQKGIRPAIFKTLVGKGHADFSGEWFAFHQIFFEATVVNSILHLQARSSRTPTSFTRT